MAWLDFIKTIRQNDDQEKKRAQQGGFAGFVGRGLNLVDNTIDKGAEVTRNVNQDLGNYFTPKANQIRTRDFLRELPGATVKVGTGIGKFVGNTAQSINRGFVNTYLSGKEPGQQSPEDRKKAIDELTSKYSEEERNKLADEAQSGKVKSGPGVTLYLTRKQLGSLSNDRLEARKKEIDAEPKHLSVEAKNPFSKFLLGSEPGEKSQSVQTTFENAKKTLSRHGIDGPAGNALAFTAAGTGAVLDAPTGIGSVVKGIGKQGIEQLAKEGGVDGVRAILKSQAPKLAEKQVESLVPQLVKATTVDEVKSILASGGRNLIKPIAAPIKAFEGNVRGGAADINALPGNVKGFASKLFTGKNPAIPKSKTFYRGGGEGSMPKNMTAKDVIDYERNKLGNSDVKLVQGIDAKNIKSDNLMWVTKDQASAKEYGQVSPVTVSGHRVIAEDGQGGQLIELNKQTGSLPVPTSKLPKTSGYGEEADRLLGNLRYKSEVANPKTGFKEQLKEQFYDKLSPVNDFIKTIETHTGKKLATEDNPYELMRLYQGMPDVVQQRVQGIADVLKQAPDINAAKVVGLGRQIIDRAGRGVGSTLSADDARTAISNVQRKLGADAFDKTAKVVDAVTEYNKGLLDDLHKAGIISDDALKAINEVGAHYFSKFNVIDHILKSDQNRALFSSAGSYNATKQSLSKILASTKGHAENAQILDPIESLVRSTDSAMRLIAKNNIWHSFDRLADVAPDLVQRSRDPTKVLERISLATDNKELRPIRNKLDRLMSTRGGWVKDLERQVNQLEKKGLNLSLKSGGQRMTDAKFLPSGLGGDVPTSQTGKLTTDFVSTAEGIVKDPARAIIDLGRSRDRFVQGAKDALPANVPGSTGLRPISDFQKSLDITKKADAVQGKISDVMQGPAKAVDSAVTAAKMGAQDTGSFVRNLIENGSRSDIDKIKKMVDVRDTKMHSILDELGSLKSQYDDVAGTIRTNLAGIHENADQAAKEGYELISGFGQGINGKLAVPKEVADVFAGKNAAQRDHLTGVMAAVNGFVKQNLTSNNPAFALITNPIRDFKNFAYNAQDIKANPLSIVKHWVSGFAQRVGQGDAYKRFVAAGGKSGFYSHERTGEDLAKSIAREVQNRRVLGVQVGEVNNAKDFIREAARVISAPYRVGRDALHSAASVLEDAPRVAQFQASLKAGKTDTQAAFNARNVTVDFQQSGRIGQTVNAWVPFLNARAQGTIKTVEAVKRNPARAAAVYAGLTATPILLAAANNSAHEDVMKMIPDSDRRNNFIIVLGNGQDESGRFNQVIKIPKSDVDKILGDPLENFARFLSKDDPKGFGEMLTNFVGDVLPFDTVKDGKFNQSRAVGSITPPLFKVPYENVANKNLYNDSPIVSKKLEGLPPSEQFRSDDPFTAKKEVSTSFIDKLLAPITGSGSPLKAENTRRAFTGNLFSNPADQLGGKLSGAGATKINNEFYGVLKKTQPNKESASNHINDSIARGDYAEAQRTAKAYNTYLAEQFGPFAQTYGAEMTQELADNYAQEKIVLTPRSIKQRQRGQLKKQAGK